MQNNIQKIHLLSGPNLNLLGRREPEIYGYTNLADIIQTLSAKIEIHNQTAPVQPMQHARFALENFQSNSEGAMIDYIHQRFEQQDVAWFIINMGGWTHTSIALRDAFAACLAHTKARMVEVHLSNIYQREAFRQKSYTAELADVLITGAKHFGYEMALDYILKS